MTQYSLNLEKDTSLSTRQTVPFPASDLIMRTTKSTKLSKEMGVQSVKFDDEDALMEWVTCSSIIAGILRDLFDNDLS